MMLVFLRSAAIGLALISTTAHAEIVFVKWDKGGSEQMIAAFDLATRKMLWEVKPCKTPNFAERTSVGILTGCDDSNVVLLDPTTGNEIWRRDLVMAEPSETRRQTRPFREVKVNRFHAEKPEGFFVSVSDEVYLLVGKKGEYLMRCTRDGCNDSPV